MEYSLYDVGIPLPYLFTQLLMPICFLWTACMQGQLALSGTSCRDGWTKSWSITAVVMWLEPLTLWVKPCLCNQYQLELHCTIAMQGIVLRWTSHSTGIYARLCETSKLYMCIESSFEWCLVRCVQCARIVVTLLEKEKEVLDTSSGSYNLSVN